MLKGANKLRYAATPQEPLEVNFLLDDSNKRRHIGVLKSARFDAKIAFKVFGSY
jgi:hypothetical protein